MNIVILGATKGIGRALGRLITEKGHPLFLLGRNLDDLGKTARDLEVRGKHMKDSIPYALCDLERPESFASALEAVHKHFARIDAVVITAGIFSTQDVLESDLKRTQHLLTINLTNTLLLCEYFRKSLLEQGGGILCVFSSVAGERGRKPVGIYGASKAALSHYLEALDHKYNAEGLRVICVKPGFIKTSMTAGLKPPPFAGEPEQVARDVFRALERPRPVVFTPPIWRWIFAIILRLPRFMMRRLSF